MLPALTVIVPPGRIPRLDSEVPVVNSAAPIPVAGEPDVLDELELDDGAVEELLDDDDVELLEGSSTCCTSAEIWLLTRFKAVSLAMLAKPFARLVSAWPITLMSASSADCA